MKHSIKTGFSFGLTTAIITTIGLMVGLNSSTHSVLAVLGGIIIIAIADGMSDALGIHISEESEGRHSSKEIWESTVATFITKLIFTLSFTVPMLLFELNFAIIVSIIWGMIMLVILSYGISKSRKVNPWKAIAEHAIIALIVIALANYIGQWVALIFG
ncbi:MAG: hypothetical protein KKB03_03650 [Nanoarchaeota archaeon]|nr:hypothetical protein [Nanoarchaeota archaeon]MBU1135380.1 hypothetical protein [Nanoarchaeota archaeon]MBU2520308.1 hypothetical protein [Nanoarchaeota archaeon]